MKNMTKLYEHAIIFHTKSMQEAEKSKK